MRCPCRKKSETRLYVDCCEPYHKGLQAAPTADVLMRSRYAAYALGLTDYLIATWHASTRPARIDLFPGQVWLLLRLTGSHTEGDRATVEFIARSRVGVDPLVLHEISRFVREDGRWFYVDGEVK